MNEHKYLVYYYIGVITDIKNEPFNIGNLIINGDLIEIIDTITNKRTIINNIISITKERHFFTIMVRIETMNDIIHIIHTSKIFNASNKSNRQ